MESSVTNSGCVSLPGALMAARTAQCPESFPSDDPADQKRGWTLYNNAYFTAVLTASEYFARTHENQAQRGFGVRARSDK
jgi:hypothetical protein